MRKLAVVGIGPGNYENMTIRADRALRECDVIVGYTVYVDLVIEVIPGLTAACSGGALLGAPLTHDFAVISLSNRLTPWEKIEKRLACAAEADLGIVLYNPRSKGRPDNLRMACDILLRYLPEDRPCGVAHSIGREGEVGEYMTLGALRDADVDMFSTVFIGNAMTKMIGGAMVTPRGYRRKEVPDA